MTGSFITMSYGEGVGLNKCELLPTPFQTCYSKPQLFVIYVSNYALTISVFLIHVRNKKVNQSETRLIKKPRKVRGCKVALGSTEGKSTSLLGHRICSSNIS